MDIVPVLIVWTLHILWKNGVSLPRLDVSVWIVDLCGNIWIFTRKCQCGKSGPYKNGGCGPICYNNIYCLFGDFIF